MRAFRESKIAEEAEGEVEGEEGIPVAEAEKSDTESAQHSDVISNIPHLSSLPSKFLLSPVHHRPQKRPPDELR